MSYVDGFLLPLPNDKVDAYREQSEAAGKIWMEHGALAYRECIADDLSCQELIPLSTPAQAKENETVVFAYISFKSREHRDEVNAKVMADPRLKETCNPENIAFDCKRMAYGGFKTLVNF